MKTTSLIARYLLGLISFVFGLNGFLHFIPMPPPTGVAGQFLGALYISGELSVIMALQLGAGVLLLANRFVPLALTVIGPVVANILLFHVFMERSGLPFALFVSALWTVAALDVRSAFAGIFVAQSSAKTMPSISGATARPHGVAS